MKSHRVSAAAPGVNVPAADIFGEVPFLGDSPHDTGTQEFLGDWLSEDRFGLNDTFSLPSSYVDTPMPHSIAPMDGMTTTSLPRDAHLSTDQWQLVINPPMTLMTELPSSTGELTPVDDTTMKAYDKMSFLCVS